MPPPTAPLPPRPSLLALLLVVNSRSGPRLVFHYPPEPTLSPSPSSSSAAAADAHTETSDGSSDDEDSRSTTSAWSSSDEGAGGAEGGGSEDWESGSEGEGSRASASKGGGGGGGRSREGATSRQGGSVMDEEVEAGSEGSAGGSGDENERARGREAEDEGGGKEEGKEAVGVGRGMRGTKEMPWERVLEFSAEGLAKMLSPPRGFHKRRFEMGVEGLVFLGAPMFAREDGTWKKKRRGRRRDDGGEGKEGEGEENVNEADEAVQAAEGHGSDADVDEGVGMADEKFDLQYVATFEPGYGHDLLSGAASLAGSEAKSISTTGGESDLNMFNVVFVLNPPVLEYHLRVEEMYDNVVKKFAKTLKYEQAQSNYVWREAQAIMTLKEKAKVNKTPYSSLWSNIVSTSALAKSMAIIYDSISSSKIAHTSLNDVVEISLQIPQAISTPYVPTATEPQVPGLWLTTATLIDDDDAAAILSPHSALLLLEDTETLLKEIEDDAKELSKPLAFFVRNHTPTKSLQKLSIALSLDLKDVQFLAGHLIYWRRARAIPPLHPRDTYIMSPNADLRALSAAIPAYAARFSSLPPLPKMLQMLSSQTKPYGNHIPSKDHREAYMGILAWLMRGGWVTQLRTFAWLRVPAEVKVAVAVKMNGERRRAAEEPAIESRDHHMTTRGIFSPARSRAHSLESDASRARSLVSPGMTAYRTPPRALSDAGSAGSGRTAILLTTGTAASSPQAHAPLVRPSPLHIAQPASPSPPGSSRSHSLSSPVSSTSAAAAAAAEEEEEEEEEEDPDPSHFTASIIHSPHKAVALEARWIEHIEASFEDPETRELWPVLLKYLDGRHALEEVALREGLKRKKVAAVVSGLIAGEWLLTVRHW